jgi:hypothetical protein
MSKPSILNIERHDGQHGKYCYTVEVRHNGNPPETITFVGTVYDSSVVMCYGDGLQLHVHQPERYGLVFNEDWIRRFWE